MPSRSLSHWMADRMVGLSEIDTQCMACVAAIPANPHLIDENCRAYILLLSAHFQGFCRDLYTECAQIIASRVRLTLRGFVQEQFTVRRQLDHGNPNIDNLKKDFDPFGLTLAMAAHDPANHARLVDLRVLNEWRNNRRPPRHRTARRGAFGCDDPGLEEFLQRAGDFP